MREKKLILYVAFIAAFLCAPILANGQHRPPTNSLVLTTLIVSREQLRNNALEMKLRLRFANVGHRALILHRQSLLLAEIGIFEDLGRPTKDAFGEVSGMDYVPHPGSFIKYHKWAQARPGKDFIVLAPSHVFTMSQSITTQIPTRKSSDAARFLLTVKLSSWFGSERLASRLRRRWWRYGNLWSDSITSEPMAFSVRALGLPPNKALDRTADCAFFNLSDGIEVVANRRARSIPPTRRQVVYSFKEL